MRLFACLFIVMMSYSQVYTIKEGKMKFLAIANTVGIESDLIGEGNGLSGELNLESKTFRFVYDLWKIDTGIELRNDHMHENYLETEAFPEAIFEGKVIFIENDSIAVEGIFKLHGEEQKISVKGSIIQGILTAKWKLDLNDYKIDIPERFLIAKMNETLDMEISGKLEKSE